LVRLGQRGGGNVGRREGCAGAAHRLLLAGKSAAGLPSTIPKRSRSPKRYRRKEKKPSGSLYHLSHGQREPDGSHSLAPGEQVSTRPRLFRRGRGGVKATAGPIAPRGHRRPP